MHAFMREVTSATAKRLHAVDAGQRRLGDPYHH